MRLICAWRARARPDDSGLSAFEVIVAGSGAQVRPQVRPPVSGRQFIGSAVRETIETAT